MEKPDTPSRGCLPEPKVSGDPTLPLTMLRSKLWRNWRRAKKYDQPDLNRWGSTTPLRDEYARKPARVGTQLRELTSSCQYARFLSNVADMEEVPETHKGKGRRLRRCLPPHKSALLPEGQVLATKNHVTVASVTRSRIGRRPSPAFALCWKG